MKRGAIPALSAALLIHVITPAIAQKTQAPTTDWREEYAYTLGIQAYIFGFPYIYLPSLRWSWVTQPKPAGVTTPYAPLNHFHHRRTLSNATYRDGGSPNNDTLYSLAWVDLQGGPVILSHPEMSDRYFTFEIAGIDSDNFAYVGKRTTGGHAGSYAIIPPGWQGTLPSGIKALPPSRTKSVLIFGRTLVDGEKDLPAVHRLQDQYRLVPLQYWGKKGATLPASRDVWKPADPKGDPLAEWKTMNRAMAENPPEARLDKLVGLFGKVGVGPGRDVDQLDDPTKRGLARAAVDGRKLLEEVIITGALGKQVNGWNIPPKAIGRAGLHDDFLLRASLQSLGGIIANDPDEAVYYNTGGDAAGHAFDGTKRYVLRFGPGQLPQVNAFWSLTMYDPTHNLVANPIDRYAIGDRTPNLKRDPDGGLTIYIQATSPAPEKASNWLPSPKSGPFQLILRTYMPGPDILEQKWAPPGVVAAY